MYLFVHKHKNTRMGRAWLGRCQGKQTQKGVSTCMCNAALSTEQMKDLWGGRGGEHNLCPSKEVFLGHLPPSTPVMLGMLVTFDADKTSVYSHQSEPTHRGYTPGWAGGNVPPYTRRKYSPGKMNGRVASRRCSHGRLCSRNS